MVSCKPSACSPLMKLCFTHASFTLNLNASLYFDQVHLDLCNGLAYMHALTLRQMRPQRSSSGSAFVTDTTKRHIMTNSHVVSCTNTKQDATDECGVLAAVQQSSLPMPFQQRHHGRPCLSQSGHSTIFNALRAQWRPRSLAMMTQGLLHRADVSIICLQISNATTVHVRRPGNPKKWRARILCEGIICDLALLTVDEDEFWSEDLMSLQFVDVPELQVYARPKVYLSFRAIIG